MGEKQNVQCGAAVRDEVNAVEEDIEAAPAGPRRRQRPNRATNQMAANRHRSVEKQPNPQNNGTRW